MPTKITKFVRYKPTANGMLSERKIFFRPTLSGVLFFNTKIAFFLKIACKIAFFLSSILLKQSDYLLQGIKILSFGH